MFFLRNRYYGYSPEAGCFGYFLVFLFFAIIFAVCTIYIGVYVILGLLIIGTVIGGFAAIFALCKAFPQTVSDLSSQNFRGNKIGIILKKTGYFFVCIAKYSFNNDFKYAKDAYQKFKTRKILSFSKWVNLALAVAVFIFGLLILATLIFFAIISVAFLTMCIVNLTVATIIVMIGLSFVFNIFFVVREAIRCGKISFSPMCFKFTGRCYFSDLLLVPKRFFVQLGNWIGATWKNSINLLSNYKSWINTKQLIWFPLVIAMIISCPILSILIIAVDSVILVIFSLPIYLVDAIWILIRVFLKF